MKNKFSQIVAYCLCFILVFSFFTVAQAEQITYTTIDLTTSGANAKIFGNTDIADSIVSASTNKASTENAPDEYIKNYQSGNLAISGDSGRGARVISVLRKDSFDAMKKADGFIYDSTGEIPFLVSTGIDTNNGIILGRSNISAQTIDVNSDKPFSKLYVFYVTTLNYNGAAVITYDDNTTETKTVEFKGAQWNDDNTTTGIWSEKISLRYNFSNTKSGDVVAVSYSNDANRRTNIAVVETNVLKKVKSISLRVNDSFGSCAVFGITGQNATSDEINSFYRDQIDEKMALLPDDLNVIDKTNYMTYGTIIAEIEEIDNGKNILIAEEKEKISAIKEKIQSLLYSYTPYMTVDFKNSFNSKIWATEGENISDFSNPEKYLGAYANVSGTWVPATKMALNIPAFKALELADGYIYSEAGVPFKLDYTGGIAFGGRTSPLKDETISFDGLYADKVHLFFPATKGIESSRSYKAKILYTDGTEDTKDLIFGAISSAKPENDFLNITKMYITNDQGSADQNPRYVSVSSIDTDFEKCIKSITFSTTDQYGGYAVIGITAQLSDESTIKADIEAKIEEVVKKDIAKVESEINGLNSLINHYESKVKDAVLDGKDEFETLYTLYEQAAAKIESAENVTDLEKVQAKITFKNEMDEALLKAMVTATANGEKAEFKAEYSNKVLTLTFENNLEYNKSYTITVPSGVKSVAGMELANSYTYTFEETAPFGFALYSTGLNDVILTLKNFILASQPYFMTVAHIGADGAFKKSYLVKGTLAKEESINKTFTFEPVAQGEKYVTYILGENYETIVKEKGIEPVLSEGNTVEKLTVHPVNLETNTVKIEGVSGKKYVNIIILNPGVNISSNGQFEDGVQNQVSVKTSENGYFSATLKLNNKTSGEFKVIVNTEEASFYFASTNDKNSLINNVLNSNNETLIKSKLSEVYLKFGVDSFVPVTLADETVIAKAIIENAPYAENDFASVQKAVMEASVLDLYNSSKKENITDRSLNLLYDDVTNFSKLDEKYSVTIYSAYLKTLNSVGKVAVIDEVIGKNYQSLEELSKALLKAIFTKSVNMTDRKGVLHIEEILTKENAQIVGADLSTYFEASYKGAVNSALSATSEFSSVVDLTNKINELLSQLKPPAPPTGGGGGGGGSIDGGVVGTVTNNSPVIIPVENVTTGFRDIEEAKWAEDAINSLVNNKIVSGYPDNTFRPYENITREQIVKIICLASGVEPDSVFESRFSDANYSEWYAPYINAAYKNGIALGREDKTFGIGEGVTRQDLLVMLYRNIKEKPTAEAEFKDVDKIADYAKDAVMYFAEAGVVSGYEDGTFRPDSICTRAEAVMIIYNYLGGKK